ncbi:MAG: hypothetical protein LBV34_22270 [Nocardiopsaceae bacterium]|jgi:hypothetical protein|nr:hypothetical protein [Nocardiopsaceae bacterium]
MTLAGFREPAVDMRSAFGQQASQLGRAGEHRPVTGVDVPRLGELPWKPAASRLSTSIK